MNFKHIYKIIDKIEWQKAKDKGSYLGSSKDIKDGYIHFSDLEHVEVTLKKFFINKINFIEIKLRMESFSKKISKFNYIHIKCFIIQTSQFLCPVFPRGLLIYLNPFLRYSFCADFIKLIVSM